MSESVAARYEVTTTRKDKERLCFVIPPSVFLLDERVFMTLGILRVAAVVKESGYPLDMLDLSGIQNYVDVMRDYLNGHDTTTFCLTATTPQMPAVCALADVIREQRPSARLILGGPHVTLVNAAYKQELKNEKPQRAHHAFANLTNSFDTLVAGDGEEAIFEALRPDAPQLVDADIPTSQLFLTNRRLAELPIPARDLVDVDSYRYYIEGERALSRIAQLGCPFSCGFCGGRKSPSLRRIRMRSHESVLAEIHQLYTDYRVKAFMLYDDELNVNRGMVELMNGLSDLQERLGVEFQLRGFIKSELFNDEQAEAMHRAGFRWILTGFESGSPRILRNINKKASREDNTRCVEIARRHGLKVKALMSIGHPGESPETVADTRDWLLEVKPDDFDVTIITTYPGTPYYDDAEPHAELPNVWTYTFQGDRLHAYEVDYTQVADYYKGDPDGGYRAYVFTDFLSSEDLVRLRDEVEANVRATLNIPFNASRPAQQYEHSMGQLHLPTNILRTSALEELITDSRI
ncbi:MAG TPA: radical SAM protein [Pyrinomonadaceae bacterium]|nr:radical SAM protein [Pyrinomonadaceae bacterium]